jgi:hypothetical protein
MAQIGSDGTEADMPQRSEARRSDADDPKPDMRPLEVPQCSGLLPYLDVLSYGRARST